MSLPEALWSITHAAIIVFYAMLVFLGPIALLIGAYEWWSERGEKKKP